ncbi:hypothetical protein [Mucilaginibacter sp.]|uniref:hypothetical protein n=1 Tax=Mucilaginibacter sp. TaxID=1882438 RepID=UPI0035BBC500
MSAYLFGWNPIKFAWEDLEKDIREVYKNGKIIDNWSVASHKRIQPGDKAYLVRLGAEPKGIFGSGHIASEPKLSVRNGRHHYRIDIAVDVLLNPDTERILTFDILKTGNLSEQTWTPQASGISIRPHLVEELEGVWLNFLGGHKHYGSVV